VATTRNVLAVLMKMWTGITRDWSRGGWDDHESPTRVCKCSRATGYLAYSERLCAKLQAELTVSKEDNVCCHKNTATWKVVKLKSDEGISHRRNGLELALIHSTKNGAYGTDSYPGIRHHKSARTTDNIAVRAGLDLQSERRTYMHPHLRGGAPYRSTF